MLLFRLRFPGCSPSFRPGFPCLLLGSVYSAFCQFPFALPCFAPTAVPQVIAWLSFSFDSLCFSTFPFISAFFRPLRSGSCYLASVFLFPSSHSRLTVAFLVLVYPRSLPPVSMLPFPIWYSAFLHFLSPLHCFALQVLLQLPTSCFQLGRSP